jgi:hypothetical protein
MGRLLTGQGYRVLSARTGVDALYQARFKPTCPSQSDFSNWWLGGLPDDLARLS